jgi:hypothetical protein
MFNFIAKYTFNGNTYSIFAGKFEELRPFRMSDGR